MKRTKFHQILTRGPFCAVPGDLVHRGETGPVVLQFSGRVARRVKETRWHPSQELQTCPAAAALAGRNCRAARDAALDPGLGADVEVLEPEEMREVMKDESAAAV